MHARRYRRGGTMALTTLLVVTACHDAVTHADPTDPQPSALLTDDANPEFVYSPLSGVKRELGNFHTF